MQNEWQSKDEIAQQGKQYELLLNIDNTLFVSLLIYSGVVT